MTKPKRLMNMWTLQNDYIMIINQAMPGRCSHPECNERAAHSMFGEICERGHITMPNGDRISATGHKIGALIVDQVWKFADMNAEEQQERDELRDWQEEYGE